MALPAGITTCTVTIGSGSTFLGEDAVISGSIVADRNVVWAATGQAVYKTESTIPPSMPGGSASFALPHVDQAGFVDAAGNAVTNWYYVFNGRATFDGNRIETISKRFQVLVGQTTVDLDLVPDGPVIPGVTTPSAAVTSVNGQTGAVTVAGADNATAGRKVPLVLMIGESNSGGLAKNSELSSAQLAARPAVQIWRNDGNDGFDTLDIGTNNLRGHAQITGVTDPDGGGTYDLTRHGWENGLAGTAEAGQWAAQLYLLKAGQGGSKIVDWDQDFDPYWTTFTTRLDAAVAWLKARGLAPEVYVMASIGLNDDAAGTTAAAWGTGLTAFLARIRAAVTAETGQATVPVAFTRWPSSHTAYNAKLNDLAAADPLLLPVTTSDLTTYADGLHWNAASMVTIAQRMIAVLFAKIAQAPSYSATPADLVARLASLEASVAALQNTGVADVTWTSMPATVSSPSPGAISRAAGEGAPPVGGIASASVPKTSTITMSAASLDVCSGVALIADTAQDSSYDFASDTFAAAIYHFAGTVYASVPGQPGSGSTTTGITVSGVPSFRLRPSGSDLIGEVSSDNGSTWVVARTFTGVLTSLTNLWPKVVFAVPSDGTTTQTVRVRTKAA